MRCPCKSNDECEHLAEIVVGPQAIDEAVRRIARELQAAYDKTDSVLVLVLLAGAKRFAEDLLARLGDNRFEPFDFKVTSYHGRTQSSETVTFHGPLPCEVRGRPVLVVDDIYDSGRTLSRIVDLLSQAGAADIKTCVMLEKQCPHAVEVHLDFCGLPVPNRFLVGYGLDFEGQYRDLRCVGVLPHHVDL